MSRALLGAALFVLFAALLVLAGCSTSDAPAQTTTTTTTTTGCTGQITFRVEADGSVVVLGC